MSDAVALPTPFRDAPRQVWRKSVAGVPLPGSMRRVPEETAVALSYGSATYAVMMATPADLEDFAIGFSLTEGIIASPRDLVDLEIAATEDGIIIRMELAAAASDAHWARRRRLAGPVGCGLCGIESLAEAGRSLPLINSPLCVGREAIFDAMASLPSLQPLNRDIGALHAAAFWQPDAGILQVREDVGRHNALDKLAGAATRAGLVGGTGAVLLTSRISVEMVQKAAFLGAPIVIAVSAPTALAIRAAALAGITLIAIARQDGFEIFTHANRVLGAS